VASRQEESQAGRKGGRQLQGGERCGWRSPMAASHPMPSAASVRLSGDMRGVLSISPTPAPLCGSVREGWRVSQSGSACGQQLGGFRAVIDWYLAHKQRQQHGPCEAAHGGSAAKHTTVQCNKTQYNSAQNRASTRLAGCLLPAVLQRAPAGPWSWWWRCRGRRHPRSGPQQPPTKLKSICDLGQLGTGCVQRKSTLHRRLHAAAGGRRGRCADLQGNSKAAPR